LLNNYSSVIVGNLGSKIEHVLAEQKGKEELKEIFKQALNKFITLAQLEDDAKEKINKITQDLFKMKIYDGSKLLKHNAAKVLIENLCFDKEDAMKLIVDNLLNDEVPQSQKEKLKDIVNKYQK